jgi:hypothetical protein
MRFDPPVLPYLGLWICAAHGLRPEFFSRAELHSSCLVRYLVDGSVPKPVTSLAPDIVLRSDLAPFVTRRIRLASIKCLRVRYLQP